MATSRRYEKASVLRVHHVYKSVWTPVIGEELVVTLEDGNEQDDRALAVMKDRHVLCSCDWKTKVRLEVKYHMCMFTLALLKQYNS